MAVAEELGVEVETVLYLKTKPDADELGAVVDVLEDPVEDLVRKDKFFTDQGYDPDEFVGNPDRVVEVLAQHPRLLQRPVLVKADRAIIGRPKDRVPEFLAS